MSSVKGLQPGERPLRPTGKRRVGTGEQADLTVEGSPDHVVMRIRAHGPTVTVRRRGRLRVVGQRSCRTGRLVGGDACRLTGPRGVVARRRRRPRHAVAHPRPPSAPLCVRGRRRSGDGGLAPPLATAAGGVDPGRARTPDHAPPRAIGRSVLPPGDGARARRPGARARGGSADAGDDRLRDALAHRPTGERRDGRRVLRSARAVGRGVARLRGGTTAPADQHHARDPHDHGTHPGAPRRRHRERRVRARPGSRNARSVASSPPRPA